MATAYPEIAAPSADIALAGYQAVAPAVHEKHVGNQVPDVAPCTSAPLLTLQNTSEKGGAALKQPGPVCVQARPSGFMGGVVGVAVGAAMLPTPGGAGLLLCAFIGNRLQHRAEKKAATVYIKPEPASTTAVPVKLWKLGETAPLTDTGLRLVLEARNAAQMAIFMERLVGLFRRRGPKASLWALWDHSEDFRSLLSRQDRIRIDSYAKHMVASMGLDCTVQGVVSELSRQP